MYETACQHLEEDSDLIAVATTSLTHTAALSDDVKLSLPPAYRARALQLRAADCAHKSAGYVFTTHSLTHSLTHSITQ